VKKGEEGLRKEEKGSKAKRKKQLISFQKSSNAPQNYKESQ